ncbi:type II secretion system protein [Litorimonas cladophorae]|uniref:Type II secretion system protein n=1 Tax=Litorimonas cladophorae TaxID=1220491 RepID=A0A918NG75_9PROT|nr:type II secretion system F family protein [Litorimonas cladophorae]GGX65169.1 type II secretion system protein [Litorimonas cladophorae]
MSPESAALFQTAGSALIAVLFLLSVWIVVMPMLEGDKKKKRMESVATARESMRKSRLDNLQNEARLRSDGRGMAKNFVDRFSLEKLLEASDLKDKLAQAGLRGQKPIYAFYMTRLIAPLVGGLIGLIFFVLLNLPGWQLMQRVAMTMGLLAFGYYLPGIIVKNKAGKRLASIMPVFPDALDLLLICVESGMSVELAFGKVAEEMGDSSVELAEEFSLTTAELSYLTSRRMAYENLARRNNHPGIKAVATALVQAERYGTPLGDTLRTMASENRQLRVMAAEKKAAALPAKLTVPMILFFLPVLFIVILTPAALRIGEAFQ